MFDIRGAPWSPGSPSKGSSLGEIFRGSGVCGAGQRVLSHTEATALRTCVCSNAGHGTHMCIHVHGHIHIHLRVPHTLTCTPSHAHATREFTEILVHTCTQHAPCPSATSGLTAQCPLQSPRAWLLTAYPGVTEGLPGGSRGVWVRVSVCTRQSAWPSACLPHPGHSKVLTAAATSRVTVAAPWHCFPPCHLISRLGNTGAGGCPL